MEKTITKSVEEQIKEVMISNGIKQRWLSVKTGIFESDLSKKINGHMDWKDGELTKVEEALKFKIIK